MKKIYLVKVKTIWYDGRNQENVLFAVANEDTAKEDCKRMQIEHNKAGYKFHKKIYFYKETNYYL